ncbi:MAG: hypothetical protein AAGA68_06940 [Pseudomonadota bacterium]
MTRIIHPPLAAAAATVLLAQGAFAQETVTIEYAQGGYPSGGTITGVLSGTDLDGDGRLYAVSRFIADVFGLPFGNEVDYAEITFTGFNLDAPLTLTYDKSVADMEAFENAFMGFAYNIDGGALGDEPDEGISFAVFAPSTNWWMGEFFNFIANPVPVSDVMLTPCGVGEACAGVLGLVPNPDFPDGIELVYSDFSNEPIETTVVDTMGERVFAVDVRTNTGATFPDCLRFSDQGDLTVDGLGQTLTYRQTRLDTSPSAFQATSRTGASLAIAISGRTRGETDIVGNGVNELGSTFVFTGSENAACAVVGAVRWGR